MKRSLDCVSALVVAGVVMIAAGSASAQQTRWRGSGSFPASHSTSIAMETFKSEVLRLTKNAVQVDLFPNNTLGGGFEQVDQLRTGQIELAWGLSYSGFGWVADKVYTRENHAHRSR